MSLPFLDLDEERDEALLQFLNSQERGQECLIIHPGSHTIKFGLASQSQPFIVPNLIAYPTKKGQKIIDQCSPQEQEEKFQQLFDSQVERVLPEIEHDLRKKKYFLIDAKSAKNIKNKQVSFKIFDETNCIQEFDETEKDPMLELETDLCNTDVYHGMHGNDIDLLDLPSLSDPNTENRPFIIGRRVYCLHQDEEYTIRKPIKCGYFNVSSSYPIQQCCNDFQMILEDSFWEYLKLPKKNIDQLNVILIIPDMFSKLHVRYMISMLLQKMRFKGIFVHTESVLATYSMALPSACVVDIGSTKINVCCVDEGVITPKSLKRKHYGGDDLSHLMYRFINRQKALHYFPRFSLNLQYHVHQMMIDQIKENFGTCEMSQNEIVKTCNLFFKDKYDYQNKLKHVKQLIFNCSEALLLAPQSLFYSSMLGVLKKCKNEIEGKINGDLVSVIEGFQDPEDLIQDILHNMNTQQQQNSNQPQFKMPVQPAPVTKAPGGEDSPAGGNTPSLSVHQDNQSELDQDEEINDKNQTLFQKMQEPADIDELICKSICSHENPDTRKRLAQQIILVGGTCKLNKFVDSLEDALINRFSLPQYDDTIERVEVVLINAQQQMQMQAQLMADPSLQQNLEQYKTDPRFMSWIGASIIPKLDSSKDLFIPREKFVVEFKPYKDHYVEIKNQQIQAALEKLKNDQEEKKQGDDSVMKNEDEEENGKSGEDQLSAQQIEAIEKEALKKIKRERTMDGGVKHLKEKAPFSF